MNAENNQILRTKNIYLMSLEIAESSGLAITVSHEAHGAHGDNGLLNLISN